MANLSTNPSWGRLPATDPVPLGQGWRGRRTTAPGHRCRAPGCPAPDGHTSTAPSRPAPSTAAHRGNRGLSVWATVTRLLTCVSVGNSATATGTRCAPDRDNQAVDTRQRTDLLSSFSTGTSFQRGHPMASRATRSVMTRSRTAAAQQDCWELGLRASFIP